MRKSYAVWIVLFFGIAILAWILAGGVGMYLDLPSVAVVIVIPIPLLLSVFSGADIRTAFSAVYRNDPSDAELRTAVLVFRTWERLILLGGLFGVISGAIAIFSNISGNTEMIGKGLALALLSPLYAMILTMALTIPFHAAARRKLVDSPRPIQDI